MVTCRICGEEFKSLGDPHLKKHNLTYSNYCALFGTPGENNGKCEYHFEARYRDSIELKPHDCQLMRASDENEFCILHDPNPEKDKENFKSSFASLKKYYEANSLDHHFEGIVFPEDIEFTDTDLNNNLYFTDCIFLGTVKARATFCGKVYFYNCKFQDKTCFDFSIFKEKVTFELSSFESEARFHRVHFEEAASFWRCRFKESATFFQARFNSDVQFGYGKFANSFPHIMNFIDAHFSNTSNALFSRVDLSRTVFRFTNLAAIEFHNVIWPKRNKFFNRRRCLFDELQVPERQGVFELKEKNKIYSDTRIVYQQLTRNYENRRHFVEAGDFYYGEMECYRKSSLFHRFGPSLLNLFRISSGYGQSYLRAGIVLLVLFFIFTFSHLFNGIHPSSHNVFSQEIKYSTADIFRSDKPLLKDFGLSVHYCLEILARESERDRMFRPMSMTGEVLNSVFSLLIYVQLLLFILALRRYFKR